MKRNRSERARRFQFSEADLKLARWFWDAVQKVTAANHKPPNFEKWANSLRLLRSDGDPPRTDEEIRKALQAAQSDEFWRKVIFCPDALRKHWLKVAALRPQTQAPADPSHRPFRRRQHA